MKTPEEMAEEYCDTKQLSYVERLVITKGFIDGYEAASDKYLEQIRHLEMELQQAKLLAMKLEAEK